MYLHSIFSLVRVSCKRTYVERYLSGALVQQHPPARAVMAQHVYDTVLVPTATIIEAVPREPTQPMLVVANAMAAATPVEVTPPQAEAAPVLEGTLRDAGAATPANSNTKDVIVLSGGRSSC